MGAPQGGGHIPSPFASDIGRARLGRLRRGAVLEHLTGDGGWRQVAVFGSIHDANEALDELVASGTEPDHLRVNETAPSAGTRIAMIALGVAVALLAIWTVYILIIPR
jgi:hypothetical protein